MGPGPSRKFFRRRRRRRRPPLKWVLQYNKGGVSKYVGGFGAAVPKCRGLQPPNIVWGGEAPQDVEIRDSTKRLFAPAAHHSSAHILFLHINFLNVHLNVCTLNLYILKFHTSAFYTLNFYTLTFYNWLLAIPQTVWTRCFSNAIMFLATFAT